MVPRYMCLNFRYLEIFGIYKYQTSLGVNTSACVSMASVLYQSYETNYQVPKSELT